ncbi:protein PARALOG OF AIPP2 isoform X4 [Castanea sativa]
MQGPVDEMDHDNMYMVSSESETKFGNWSMSKKVHMRGESGTCNVCFEPCSSCMHLNRSLMGSKTEEFSDESCRVNVASQYSVNESGTLYSLKNRASDSLQHTTSETSNLLSVNSSHDSFSENADSKATLRSSVVSDALEDVEIVPKLTSGGTIAEDQLSAKPQFVLDQRISSNMYDESKAVEGHDDNISSVSRANDANEAVRNHNRNINNSTASISSLGPEGSGKATCLNKLGSSVIPPSKDLDAGSSSPKVRRGRPVGGISEVSMKKYPKPEPETDKDSGDPPDEAMKSSDQDEHDDKSNEMVGLTDMQEPPLQSVSGDESDESDIVEQDVKVCDICGDAGREDLLAICSRCSDGAEHTYCMREMLQKVPEGDWLCEECKFAEESENQKQGSEVEEKKMDKLGSCTLVSGKRCAESIEVAPAKRQALETGSGSPKPSSPSRIVTGSPKPSSPSRIVTGSPKPSSPRSPKPLSPSRIVSASPKPLSPSRIVSASPKPLSPTKIVSLSRDSSFKSIEKGKVKSAHQTSFGNHSSTDIPETARFPATGPRHLKGEGALLKSKSFNTLSSKPKVKLADEVIPPKQKGARDYNSLDMKEGPARMMSKSMSFRSSNSGRMNAAESKVKMLSSKSTHVQDVKGLKQAKERGTFERKHLSKLDRPLVSSTTITSSVSTPKLDQKLTSRGETSLPSYVSNNRDSKVVQTDGKLSLSKVTSSLGRKGVEIPVTSGGASSTSGIFGSAAEQKLNLVSPKDEPLSTYPLNTERPSNSADVSGQDGLPRSQETANQYEKTRESSTTRSRPTAISASKSVFCQKCKDSGHATEFCTIGTPQASGIDASAVRSSREESHEGNKLKAAIHAALLRRPEINRKKKVFDQPDELSTSSTEMNYELASQDQVLVSNKPKNIISTEGSHERQAVLGSSTSDSCKHAVVNNSKQFTLPPTDVFSSKVGDSDSAIISIGKHARELPSHTSTAMSSLLKTSAIPEYEYIWQGGFEVHKGGKLLDLCGGIQAHLSTCASPKVLEVVNKFPQKFPLHEVPRVSTWPSQFSENGAKEDNIALYFFAKDVESYERNYKSLLDSMIKHDLALKGNLDGVELLIFPSNQLPEKSQRWNMFFFLWGVFRGKRVSCIDSSKKLNIPSLNVLPPDKDIPSAVMTFPENLCAPRRIDEESAACIRSGNVVLTSNVPDQTRVNVCGDCDNNITSFEHTCLGYQESLEQQDGRRDYKFIPKIGTSGAQLSQEMRHSSLSLKELSLPERLDADLKTSLQVTGKSGSNNGGKTQMHWNTYSDRDDGKSRSNNGGKTQMHWDTSSDRDDRSSLKILPVDNREIGILGSVCEDKIQDRMNGARDQVKLQRDFKEDDGFMDREMALEKDVINHRKRSYLDLSEKAPPTSIGTSQKMPWNEVSNIFIDGESTGKRLKTGFSITCGHGSGSRGRSSRNDNFASQVVDPGSCSSVEEKTCDEACDEKVIPEDTGNSERYFFPLGSHRAKDFGIGDNTMPWKKHPLDEDNKIHDVVPNLELALGAETKPANKGMLPFLGGTVGKKNNQEKVPDKVIEVEDDGDSASLSLSLSFPFPDKEQSVKPVSKTEQLLSDRPNLNTPLLLFGSGFGDK